MKYTEVPCKLLVNISEWETNQCSQYQLFVTVTAKLWHVKSGRRIFRIDFFKVSHGLELQCPESPLLFRSTDASTIDKQVTYFLAPHNPENPQSFQKMPVSGRLQIQNKSFKFCHIGRLQVDFEDMSWCCGRCVHLTVWFILHKRLPAHVTYLSVATARGPSDCNTSCSVSTLILYAA